VRNLSLALLVLALSVTLSASAQTPTIDAAMAGNTYIAQPDGPGAWNYNPAALAAIAGLDAGLFTMEDWKHTASATFELSGQSDMFALNWGGYQMSKEFGLGAGYIDAWGTSTLGAGFGKTWGGGSMAWGVNWRHVDDGVNSANNVFDLGLVGTLGDMGIRAIERLKWGLVVRDLTGDIQRTWDAGLAMALGQGLNFTADWVDVTDEMDSRFRVGLTKTFGQGDRIKLGAGLDDGDLTLGATVAAGGMANGSLSFGVAWQAHDNVDDTLLLGASAQWGP